MMNSKLPPTILAGSAGFKRSGISRRRRQPRTGLSAAWQRATSKLSRCARASPSRISAPLPHKPTGAALDAAAADYAKAWEILGGESIVEAARYFAKKHPLKMPRMTVAD